jgi:hypothetical protein
MNDMLSENILIVPKVFISYAHDDDNHKVWVKELVVKLRSNGIDAIMDELTPLGSDLALFMEQGLGESHRVLCICSTRYNEKANAGISGVNYEKRIICQELMKESSSTWVIPVIRNNASEEKLPKFLSSIKYISFEDNDHFHRNYYELLQELHNKKNLPPIGPNPFAHDNNVIGIINEMNQIVTSLSSVSSHSGKVRFNYMSNSGNFKIGTGDHEFHTHWSFAGHDSIHAYKDYVYAIALTSNDIQLDGFSLQDYDFSSRSRTASIGESLIWINRSGGILITKLENIEYKNKQKCWLEISYQIVSMLESIDIKGDM